MTGLFLKKMKKNKKGFTLIELIVVIAILGILAAIAIPRFTGMTTRAEKQAITATATTILNAAEVAHLENKAPILTGTDPAPNNVGTATDIGGLVANGYLRTAVYTGYTITAGTGAGEYVVTYDAGNFTGTNKIVVPKP